jgi:hypothetical protein
MWDYASFQDYLQQVKMSKGFYLVDDEGDPHHFIVLTSNPIFYRISLSVHPVPATLPTDWTAPSGWVAPASDITPQLIVPSTMQSYLGFNAVECPVPSSCPEHKL